MLRWNEKFCATAMTNRKRFVPFFSTRLILSPNRNTILEKLIKVNELTIYLNFLFSKCD